MSTGEIIINAIIRAAAVESAVITDDSTVFVWATNAAEQVEAALAEAGYELRPNVKDQATLEGSAANTQPIK